MLREAIRRPNYPRTEALARWAEANENELAETWVYERGHTGAKHVLMGKRVLVRTYGSDVPELLKFDTPAEAEAWYYDNLLAGEFDAYVCEQYLPRHGVTLYCEDLDMRDPLMAATYPTVRRAVAALRLAMHSQGCYSTVWYQDERGYDSPMPSLNGKAVR